jgi:hypothetical protein
MVRPMSYALVTRGLSALALGASIALGATPAAAQSKDLTQLRQLFTEGRQFEDKGQWPDALARFKEVAAEKMTPQVRFHIALCEENMGKLVSAKRGFELAAAEANAAGSAAVEVPPAAKQHSDALAARIARLEIDVKGTRSSSKIMLDDVPLPSKDLNVEIEIDPGAHVVEVRDGAGTQTFRKELTLAEQAHEKLEVTVADADAPVVAPVEQTTSRSRVPAYVVGGVGVASLIVSGVFFGLRASNVSAVTATCTNMAALTGCSPFAESLASTGKLYTGLADTLLVVGLAGVGTGVALYFVLGSKKQSSSGAAPPAPASFWVSPAGQGLKVGTAF